MLKKFEKEFSEDYLMTPFLAKNQIVLFLYSESIFKMDEMTERVAKVEGTITTELFIPKKKKKEKRKIVCIQMRHV